MGKKSVGDVLVLIMMNYVTFCLIVLLKLLAEVVLRCALNYGQYSFYVYGLCRVAPRVFHDCLTSSR